MKRFERVPRAGVGVALLLAFATALALLVRSETRVQSGGMPLALAILAILIGIGIAIWLTWTAVGSDASDSTGPDDRIHWTVQKSWWVGVLWLAFFVPLALAIQKPLLWYVTSVPIAFLVATLVHECGHAAAALAFGLRITVIQLGPLRFELKTRRLAPAIAPDVGGAVVAADAYRSRLSAVVFTGAGPLANLAFTIACFVASRTPLGFLFGWASTIVLVVSLFGAQPKQSGLKTDGKALLDILFRWPSMTAERQILAEVLLGKRPREWSLPLSECLAKVDEAGTFLALLAFARAMDEQQVEIGARILEEALLIHELPQMLRSDWYLEGATFHALILGDAKRASALLERARTSGSHEPGYTLLAEGAILLVQGRQDNARAALAGWLEHISRAENPNYTRGGHEWALDELTKRLGPAST